MSNLAFGGLRIRLDVSTAQAGSWVRMRCLHVPRGPLFNTCAVCACRSTVPAARWVDWTSASKTQTPAGAIGMQPPWTISLAALPLKHSPRRGI